MEIALPLLLWINDGFGRVIFVIGLELKREGIEGELDNKRNNILPAIAAVGGMFEPQLADIMPKIVKFGASCKRNYSTVSIFDNIKTVIINSVNSQ